MGSVYTTTIDVAGDLNCTVVVGTAPAWAPNAATCTNVYSDASCQAILADAPATVQPPIQAGGTNSRPTKCYTGADGTTFNQDVKNLAIATCPQFCGFCCQTTAYTCKNVAYPRINCATVTNSMCSSALWRTVIASDCPNACGFCLLNGCIDAAPDCGTNPSICVTRGLESFVATNCQRTCGLCYSTTVSSSVMSSTCRDTASNCASWVRNGFCKNSFYSPSMKLSYCGASCGLC